MHVMCSLTCNVTQITNGLGRATDTRLVAVALLRPLEREGGEGGHREMLAVFHNCVFTTQFQRRSLKNKSLLLGTMVYKVGTL